MDVAIDRPAEKLVLDPRIDLEHLGIVFEHLVKIVLGIELAHPLHAQSPAHHQLGRRLSISRKITHGLLLSRVRDSYPCSCLERSRATSTHHVFMNFPMLAKISAHLRRPAP